MAPYSRFIRLSIFTLAALVFSANQCLANWSNMPAVSINGPLTLTSDTGGTATYAAPISINISGTHQSSYNGCSQSKTSPYFAYASSNYSTVGGVLPIQYVISVDNSAANGAVNWTDENGARHTNGSITLSSSNISLGGSLYTPEDIASETPAYGHACIKGTSNANGYLVVSFPHDVNQPQLQSLDSVSLHLWGRGTDHGYPNSSDLFGSFTFAPSVTRAATSCQVSTDDFLSTVTITPTTPSATVALGTTTIDCNRNTPVNLTADLQNSDDDIDNLSLSFGFTDHETGAFIAVDSTTPVTTTEIGVPLSWAVNVQANTETPPAPGSYARTAIINISFE